MIVDSVYLLLGDYLASIDCGGCVCAMFSGKNVDCPGNVDCCASLGCDLLKNGCLQDPVCRWRRSDALGMSNIWQLRGIL